MQITISANPWM